MSAPNFLVTGKKTGEITPFPPPPGFSIDGITSDDVPPSESAGIASPDLLHS
jgi:hypothetical protein